MKKSIVNSSFLAAVCMLVACAGTDKPTKHADVTLKNCAIQRTIPGASATGAFLTMHKHGNTPLALVKAAAPAVTDHVEIHEMVMKNGKMMMSQIHKYPLTEGDNVFKKGGYHVMLMGLDKTLSIGETYPLTLTFSDGSSKTCAATVKSIKASGGKGHNHGKAHTH